MTSFKATGLGPEILSAVADLGYKAPTPIQEKAIPHLLDSDTDLIALAQTGTGKTAAFGLPMLQRLDPNSNHIQALILCPTRELALQIVSDFENYSKNIAQLKVVAIYGGASAERQIQQLRKGAQVVVGTPGRTRDLIERRELDIRDIQWLVLDEADEMLDRGFKHDLNAILSSTPKQKRTLLFSATMPEHISEIARTYLHKPKQISVAKINSGAENVTHRYYVVPPRERYRYLRQLLKESGDLYGIVFCRTKRKTREVARRLRRDGFNAGALEGDMPQNKRDRVMGRFRNKELNLLVATDVAARGVDVAELTHVINFNLPDEAAVYIHRSGRTGRAGNAGISAALLSEEELDKIPPLEKLAGKSFAQSTLKQPPAPRKPKAEEESEEAKPEKQRKESNERPPKGRTKEASRPKAEKQEERNTRERRNDRKSERKDEPSNARRTGREKQAEKPSHEKASARNQGRGRHQNSESNADMRGKGRDRNQASDNDRGRGRNNRKQEDRQRNGRNGRRDDNLHGEPLRRKTERAYDSVPVITDTPANRRRKKAKKEATSAEVEALVNAIKAANPKQPHLKKQMPVFFDKLSHMTWEEVIAHFVAYLDEQGLLQVAEQEEEATQETAFSGLKALFRGFSKR